jgi:hypothetical protein
MESVRVVRVERVSRTVPVLYSVHMLTMQEAVTCLRHAVNTRGWLQCVSTGSNRGPFV